MRDLLTQPQINALRALRDLCDEPIGTAKRPAGYASPRSVARLMWPDSVGWTKRTRKYGGSDPGAVGGTMPMKAAAVLWRLYPRFATCERNRWTITFAGRRYLDSHDNPPVADSEGGERDE